METVHKARRTAMLVGLDDVQTRLPPLDPLVQEALQLIYVDLVHVSCSTDVREIIQTIATKATMACFGTLLPNSSTVVLKPLDYPISLLVLH